MDDFPKWKPQARTIRAIKRCDLKTRKTIVRNAASNFISRPDVRNKLFEKKGDKCYICGEKATQIDHKVSAYEFAVNTNWDLSMLNSLDNLFPICKKCNSSKSP